MEAKQEIGLGDVVALGWGDGYDTATVSQVHADGTVDLFRPYTSTADFSYSGKGEGSSAVICYVGISTTEKVDPTKLKLIRKGPKLRY